MHIKNGKIARAVLDPLFQSRRDLYLLSTANLNPHVLCPSAISASWHTDEASVIYHLTWRKKQPSPKNSQNNPPTTLCSHQLFHIQSWQLVNALGLAVEGLRAHMVDQDKSHLHGRHVSENPLTSTAPLPHSQVTYSTKKGRKMKTLLLLLLMSTQPGGCEFLWWTREKQLRPLYLKLKGKRAKTDFPVVSWEGGTLLNAQMVLDLCRPSLRICINSAVFSVDACWETNITVQQKGINHLIMTKMILSCRETNFFWESKWSIWNSFQTGHHQEKADIPVQDINFQRFQQTFTVVLFTSLPDYFLTRICNGDGLGS